MTPEDLAAFKKDLTALINTHGLDGAANTPDYAIADHMVTVFAGFVVAVVERDKHKPSAFARNLVQESSDVPSSS